jgi:hypothetical protein
MKKLSEEKTIYVTGYFLAMRSNSLEPVLYEIEGTKFVPIFSTVEKLRDSMSFAHVDEYDIKTITDGIDFLESIEEAGFNGILDPYIVNGNTRFTLLKSPQKAAEDD